MARPPKVDYLRVDFHRSIASADRLFQDVLPLSAIRTGHGRLALHVKQVRRVIELAFLGVCAAWEEFLEETFVRYLAGAAPAAGGGPTLRLGKCDGIEHAYQVFTANPSHDPTRHFLSWTNPDEVVSMASLYFQGGNPYAPAIGQFIGELRRSVKLRNRIAHSSQKSVEDFRTTANHYLQPAAVTQGYGVGDLLRVQRRRDFTGLPPAAPGHVRTYFDAHMDMFRVMADQVVPP